MLRVLHIPECTCHICECLHCGVKGEDVGYCTETLIPWYRIIGWTGTPNTMSFKDIFLLILKLSFFSVKCFPHIPRLMFIKGKCLRRLAKKKKTLGQSWPSALFIFVVSTQDINQAFQIRKVTAVKHSSLGKVHWFFQVRRELLKHPLLDQPASHCQTNFPRMLFSSDLYGLFSDVFSFRSSVL